MSAVPSLLLACAEIINLSYNTEHYSSLYTYRQLFWSVTDATCRNVLCLRCGCVLWLKPQAQHLLSKNLPKEKACTKYGWLDTVYPLPPFFSLIWKKKKKKDWTRIASIFYVEIGCICTLLCYVSWRITEETGSLLKHKQRCHLCTQKKKKNAKIAHYREASSQPRRKLGRKNP